MKSFILTTAVIFFALITTQAATKDRGVSNFSKEQFAFDFDHPSDATWRRTYLFDEVHFTQDGKKYTAFYDTHAQLVGTTSIIQFDGLPLHAQQEIKKNYKDYSVESIICYNDNELNATDIELFGLQTDAADSYFVELKKANKRIILQVFTSGDVTFFHDMK
jgi:hypothetical protein